MIEKKKQALSDVDFWFLIYLGFFSLWFFDLLYQNGDRKNWPVMGVAIVTCKYVYLICLMKEKKKRKIKAHQWSLNLLSWCLSHWSMIMTYFVLWTVFKYLFIFPVMLSSLNNGDVFRLNVSVMNSQKWTMFYFWQYTFFFFDCLFVFIHFSCSWVTKYLECESLCSSCTRKPK